MPVDSPVGPLENVVSNCSPTIELESGIGALTKSVVIAPAIEPLNGDRRAGPVDGRIGHRIRQCRTNKGLSQEELAGQLGISCQQLQKYEAGANRIAATRVMRIAEVLGIDVTRLLRDGDATPQESPAGPSPVEFVRLINAFAGIKNNASRDRILGVGRSAGQP